MEDNAWLFHDNACLFPIKKKPKKKINFIKNLSVRWRGNIFGLFKAFLIRQHVTKILIGFFLFFVVFFTFVRLLPPFFRIWLDKAFQLIFCRINFQYALSISIVCYPIWISLLCGDGWNRIDFCHALLIVIFCCQIRNTSGVYVMESSLGGLYRVYCS